MEAIAEVSKPPRLKPVAKTSDRPPIVISPSKAGFAEQKFNSWFVVVPTGTLSADLDLVAAPFDLISDMLNMFDNIRAVTEDDARMFDLIVVDKTPASARCRVVRDVEMPTRSTDDTARMPGGFDIRLSSSGESQPGWLVVRLNDNVILNYGHTLATREDAIRFCKDHPTVKRPGK